MSKLDDLGVTVSRTFVTNTSSVDVMGIKDSSSTKTTLLRLELPKKPVVQAVFQSEGMLEKISKVWKRELQTGDAAFDAAVYISTETPEQTAAMLQNSSMRVFLGTLTRLGPISISGQEVVLTVPGHDGDADKAVTAFVSELLK